MPYHADNIAERLVQSASALLADLTRPPLSLIEVARHAGLTEERARSVVPDDATLVSIVCEHGTVRLTDALSQRLVAIAPDDRRAALIAVLSEYVSWTRDNRGIYRLMTQKYLTESTVSETLTRYDASFVPVIRRLLGEETDQTPSYRALYFRALAFGLADMDTRNHLTVWTVPGSPELQLADAIAGFVDMLLATPPHPIRPV